MTSSHPLRSPLSKVRGHGSAKSGVHHWWMQRLSAVALIPLVSWFVYSFLTQMLGAERAAIANWFDSPLNAMGTLALLTAMFYHARLGLQVVIEDYVHTHWKKNAMLIFVSLLSAGLTVVCWVSVLKLHLNGM